MKFRGFTLTELLVVIAIVATLAGIGYPVSRSLIGKSREVVCLGNLRGIGIALQGYLQDYNQMLPVLEAGRKTKVDASPVLETILAPYAGGPDIFHCPADSREFEKSGSSYFWNTTQNGLHITRVGFFGINGRPDRIPLVSDKEAWHPGGTNFLYADSSSSSKTRFVTGD